MTAQVVAVPPDPTLLVRTVDLPEPQAGQVTISVRACGVNPTDYKSLLNVPWTAEPVVLGFEAAGVVSALGADVARDGQLMVGEEVIAYPVLGSYATDIVLDASDVFHKPRPLDFSQAANLLLVGTTASEMLEVTGVRAGMTILVHGASSSTGVSVMQQAAALPVGRVIATASERNFDLVRSFGGEPVAYGSGLEQRLWAMAPGGVDAALDCVGTEEAMQVSVALVSARSRRVTIAEAGRAAELDIPHINGRDPASFAYRNAQRRRIVAMADASALTVPVARSLPLSAAAEALAILRDGHPGGKLALLP